ncbi:MAG: D-glycero-beta-D-manno-heptose 1-phosphate adenylyltransferase [Bacteroidales bacterium]|jgi:rfaE bifunctional protein nucleotidyltransferase chain/domain|nr:D-glycero-beta-D-manno-heptose 1-phosphate adenylyltransferase [Bacteroidales bacterium]MDY0334549.1 D-glycero-beta-D-manno-heptose 1-phosphate adenylyltransferase [Bacteroidales bacterium]NCU37096.1 D-glycero-beta-D-manno-heptose 1-phosphate adenylyltransferase [Candidatus Falkowbacteria bacterium]
MQHLLNIQSKIFPQANDDLGRLVAYWKFKNQKIVFTNGCFDILHRGHIDYLAKAADLGNVLVVGLNADASVSRLKGAGRPVQDQDGRALVLAALRFVSAVVLFDEDTPYQLIKAVQPDVLVKGSDYKTDDIVGADIVKAKGGSVQTIDFLEGYSTSGIIRRLLASSQDK